MYIYMVWDLQLLIFCMGNLKDLHTKGVVV